MLWVILIVGVIIAIAAALIVIGLRSPQSSDERLLLDRLEEFSKTGEEITLEKIELSLPFTQRIIYPLARMLGKVAVRFTPQHALQTISKKLDQADIPTSLDPTIFLAIQFICMGFFTGALILVFTVSKIGWPFGWMILAALAMGVVGYFFPQVWLSSKITKRQKTIRKALPDALDLLTICVEAGLGFDAAISKVVEKWDNDLSAAFGRVLAEVQLGKLRRDALRSMAERIDLAEMTSFIAAVIQSEQLGVSLAKVLRIQSDQMRVKRRQFAEEEAHKAPIKMLIPMAGLIFPALMIVLLTPAGLQLARLILSGVF